MERVLRNRSSGLFLFVGAAAVSLLCVGSGLHAQSTMFFTSPVMTPGPAFTPPAPTPTQVPGEVEISRRYATQQLGIPSSRLVSPSIEHVQYRELGRAFTAVTFYDTGSSHYVLLLVDLKDHSVVEGRETLQQAEGETRQARYGRLQPDLWARLEWRETTS